MQNNDNVAQDAKPEMSFKHTITGFLAVVGVAVSVPAVGYLAVLIGRHFGVAIVSADIFIPFGSVKEFILLVLLGGMSISLLYMVLNLIPLIVLCCDKLGKSILKS